MRANHAKNLKVVFTPRTNKSGKLTDMANNVEYIHIFINKLRRDHN